MLFFQDLEHGGVNQPLGGPLSSPLLPPLPFPPFLLRPPPAEVGSLKSS